MKRLIKSFLDKIPYIKNLQERISDFQEQEIQFQEQVKKLQEQEIQLQEQARQLQEQARQLHGKISELQEQIGKQGVFPAGHYYSPIPSRDEVLEYIESNRSLKMEFPGINLNEQNQFELLNEYSQYYKDLSFPENQELDHRYYYQNDWFSYSDAIFLYSFLRKNKPRRIIEVGSGFSSAVMLDTVDVFFPRRPEITFIEPYPDRLNSLLRKDDKNYTRIVAKNIQEVSTELFSSLESGDLLFIDSSHVMKCNSDLHLLMFDILPLLPSGAFVHFHDIFRQFEYLPEWLEQGIFWNENYFLRAFLSYNSEWDIYFFNDYVATSFENFIKNKMPLCTKNSGGSLYLQRKGKVNIV